MNTDRVKAVVVRVTVKVLAVPASVVVPARDGVVREQVAEADSAVGLEPVGGIQVTATGRLGRDRVAAMAPATAPAPWARATDPVVPVTDVTTEPAADLAQVPVPKDPATVRVVRAMDNPDTDQRR
jgi:hypothetical protein